MKNICEKAMNDKSLVSIYTDRNETDSFLVGFVLASSEQFILIQSVSSDGLNDGLELCETKEIYRVDINGKYESKIMKLWKNANQEVVYKVPQDITLASFAAYTQENNYMVSIETCNSELHDSFGLVENVAEDHIVIKGYDKYGAEDGLNYIKFDCITRFSCDGIYERNIQAIIQ